MQKIKMISKHKNILIYLLVLQILVSNVPISFATNAGGITTPITQQPKPPAPPSTPRPPGTRPSNPRPAPSRPEPGTPTQPLAPSVADYGRPEAPLHPLPYPGDWEYETNFRTMGKFDVATITNLNGSQNSDYQPEPAKIKNVISSLEEFENASIKEYKYFKDPDPTNSPNNNLPKRPVSVRYQDGEYANQLNYLIKHNIINRDNVLVINKKAPYLTGLSRYSSPIPLPQRVTEVSQDRYYDPSQAISKTDFLTELSKTESVIQSRPLIIRGKYSRATSNLKSESVDREPLEGSTYQKYMGNLGIDSLSNDVVIDHRPFQENFVVTTNDISELYLRRLTEQGIINQNEFLVEGATEGNKFFNDAFPRVSNVPNNDSKYPLWLQSFPLRMNYDKAAMAEVSKKMIETYNDRFNAIIIPSNEIQEIHYNQYPEGYLHSNRNEAPLIEKKNSVVLEWKYLTGKDGTTPWGTTYTYNLKSKNFNDPFDDFTGTISKRKSFVEDPNGGYRFFKTEKISLLDAYVLAYKFLKVAEEEVKLTPEQVDYINSAFALNLSNMLPEEVSAVKYLIATGIVDGNDPDLIRASSKQLTNQLAVNLLVKIDNKSYRKQIVPHLSEIDKDMLKKGYAQANLNIPTQNIPFPDAKVEIANNLGLPESEIKAQLFDPDTIKYDFLYIRIPKGLEQVLKLVTNDNYRVTMPEFSTHKSQEDNYTWKKYKISKLDSTSLVMMGMDANNVYSYTGISGSGIYIIEANSISSQVRKLPLQKSYSNEPEVLNLISPSIANIIKQDIELREGLIRRQAQLQQRLEAKLINNQSTPSKSLQLHRTLTTPYLLSLNPLSKPTQLTYNLPRYAAPPAPTEKEVVSFSGIEESALEFIQFDGQFLISKDASGKYFLNRQVLPEPFTSQVEIYPDPNTKRYSLVYQPKSGKATAQQAAYFSRSISILNGQDKQTLPAYAKYNNGGKEPVTLISKQELEHYKIIAESDKVLYNPETGQRALLNTHDNMTLIGNNITYYPKGAMLVNAFGGQEKVFYNLKIILELINDTVKVEERAGKEIYASNSGDKFKLVPIKDVELNHDIDKTFILENGESGTYMNFSAVSGLASNFMYFKNRDEEFKFNALIVYKPNTRGKFLDQEATPTDNKLSSHIKGVTIPNTVLLNDPQIQVKNKIMSFLFKGSSEEDKTGDIIGGNYLYDIYLFTDGSADSSEKALNNFLGAIGKGKPGIVSNIRQGASITGFGQHDSPKPESDIQIKPLISSKVMGQDFLDHESSGNLYARLQTKDGKESTAKLREVTYQNFYLSTPATNPSVPTSPTTPQPTPTIYFRRHHFYQNTPENMIPLEIYGGSKTQFGYLQTGKQLVNFGEKKYKLPQYGKNNNVPLRTSTNNKINIGIGTKLELPYKLIPAQDISNAPNIEGVLKNLCKISAGEFRKEFGDDRIADAMAKGEIGWKENLSKEDMLDMLSGTWDGLVDSYSTYKTDNKKAMPFELDFNSYILAGGRNHSESITPEMKKNLNMIPVIARNNLNQITPSNETNPIQPASPQSQQIQYSNAKIVNSPADINPQSKNLVIKPSLVIPAGTMLVAANGDLKYQPSNTIRSEVHYSADIINNLVSRIHDLNPETNKKRIYLSELPKNSIVLLDNDKAFVKQTEKQDNLQTRLRWVPSITIPIGTIQPKASLDTYTMFERFVSDWGDVNLGYHDKRGAIQLKQIVGKGLFTLPNRQDIQAILTNNQVKDMLIPKSPLWISANEFDDNYSLTALTVDSIARTFLSDSTDLANLPMKVLMPPSLEVEKYTDNPQDTTYRVVQYHDISKFQVDSDDSYVKYLRLRDTPAEEILGITELIDRSSLDATNYLNLEQVKARIANTSIFGLITTVVIPTLSIMLILWIVSVYIILQFPISRGIVVYIYENFNINILFINGQDWMLRKTSLLSVFVVCLLLAVIGVLFSESTLPEFLMKATQFSSIIGQ